MEKECERVDGDGQKDDPPVVTKSKVEPEVDASCNAFCFRIYYFINDVFAHNCSEMCSLCNISSAYNPGEAPPR